VRDADGSAGQKSSYVTLDDDINVTSMSPPAAAAAAAAHDVIDVSRPVSQTSLSSRRAPDDVGEIP